MKSHILCLVIITVALSPCDIHAADMASKLTPGKAFTVQFPEMPSTFYAMLQQLDVKAQMSVYLPTNYSSGRKYPLFIFLDGWDGGTGANPGVARSICEGRDFICVGMPLFKAPGFKVTKPNVPGDGFIMTADDGKYMWPYFKSMLKKLETLVPNIDPAHQVLGGFSNGAHATAALIDGSNAAVTRLFSAFLFVEGGGRLQHYELLKGKTVMMVSSNPRSRPRAQQILDMAKAAGARTTFLCEDVGKHDFPVSAYPPVRTWLRGPALKQEKP